METLKRAEMETLEVVYRRGGIMKPQNTKTKPIPKMSEVWANQKWR